MPSRSPADRCTGERGAVTAEFATAIPAVVLVLVLCLAGGQLATQQLRLQDAASVSARAAARGEAASSIGARVRHLVPRASVAWHDRGELVCVTVSAPGSIGPLAPVMLAATGCALGELG